MNAPTLDSQFYELSKEQMEEMSPPHLRAIIRKAFENKKAGYGPGPTMSDVIQHYEDETNYRLFRSTEQSIDLGEIMDVLFEANTQMEGMIYWRLPSVVMDSTQKWPVGRFNFSAAKRTHPELYTRIEDTGWTI